MGIGKLLVDDFDDIMGRFGDESHLGDAVLAAVFGHPNSLATIPVSSVRIPRPAGSTISGSTSTGGSEGNGTGSAVIAYGGTTIFNTADAPRINAVRPLSYCEIRAEIARRSATSVRTADDLVRSPDESRDIYQALRR